MDTYDLHFLDSNVIIGLILEWDNLNGRCSSYFGCAADKNTSQRVYNECKSVFNKSRGWSLQFIRQLKDEFAKQSFTNPHKELNEFSEKFIEKICIYEPEDCKKVDSVIKGLINDCESRLINIMKNSNFYINFKMT